MVATGDAVIDWMPFLNDGYPEDWVKTLDALDSFDFDRIIPGHGEVAAVSDTLAQRLGHRPEPAVPQRPDDLTVGVDLARLADGNVSLGMFASAGLADRTRNSMLRQPACRPHSCSWPRSVWSSPH